MSAEPLTSLEVYQLLRDIALGARVMRRQGEQTWAQIYYGLMTVEFEGWLLSFYNDCGFLDYCDSFRDPQGRAYDFSSLHPLCKDPVELMNSWEHEQLEKLLAAA